jgi:DNA-binding GntR family transcriptional regulator
MRWAYCSPPDGEEGGIVAQHTAQLPPDHPGSSLVTPLPQRHGLSDDVYEAIKRSIMDHVVEPGARLSIDRLARDLGVSQTPTREALARLEADGLVTKTALKGYSISPVLSRRELDDLFGLRLLLEPWAAAEAATRGDETLAAGITAELARFTEAPAEGGYDRYQAVANHDARFHDLLLAAAGNEAVRQAFERTHCHLHIFRLYYAGGMDGAALREHRQVAEAVIAGDAAAARSTMASHLEASRARLLVAYR